MNEMKKTKEAMNEILKEAMSKKYCGSTRFDYLDEEEIPMIRAAMSIYASQQTSELKAENERLRGLVEKQIRDTIHVSYNYETIKEAEDKAWQQFKTKNNL